MSSPHASFTYHLALRPIDKKTTMAELANTVQRVLLTLSDVKHGVSITKIHRPPLEDDQGAYVEVTAAGKERWYLDLDEYLQSQGLRVQLLELPRD